MLENYSENSFRFARITGIVILLGLLIYRVLLIFSYSGEIGGIDNNFVYDVTRSIAGNHIYTNPADSPFAITLYSPLYYTICSSIGKAINIDTNEPIYVYQLCRAVSLACDIITCILLYNILKKRFSIAKELSALAVACFACIICLLGYTFSRCDSLLLTFYAATIWVLTNKSPNNRNAQVLLLALFSVLCILSKQNGIIVPILIISWLLIHHEKKRVFYYVIFFTVFSTVILVYYFLYSHFFENTVTALRNRIDLPWFYKDIFKRMVNSLWILPLYIAGLLAIKQWIKPASREDRSLAAIFIIQTLFSLAASLKWGSTAGYFNESFLLSFILIARTTSAFNTQPAMSYSRNIIAGLVPLIFLLFINTIAEGYLFFIQNRATRKIAYEQQKEIRNYLQPNLQGQSVLNLANPNSDFFKTLLYKNIVVPNMDMVDCCTLPDQTFDYSRLKEKLKTGQIGYLLTYGNVPPEQIWGISLQDFHKDTTINGHTIYRYQSPR